MGATFIPFVARLLGPVVQTVVVWGGGAFGIGAIFKNFVVPSLVVPVITEAVSVASISVAELLSAKATSITVVPRFPSIIGNMPFLGFVPRWTLPFADALLLGGVVAASPLSTAGVATVGLRVAASYCLNSVKFGWGAKAAIAAGHLILQNQFRAAAAAAAVPNGPVNVLADPGILPVLPLWFDAIDPILRVGIQGVFYGAMAYVALKALGKSPLQAPVKIIEPPSINDIIVEQAGARMASFDYCTMLFVKLGVPALGLLMVLGVFYKIYSLQTMVTEQALSLENSKLAKVKPEQTRNSQGQYTKEAEPTSKIKK